MTWTKTATLETNDLTQFDGSSGTGISASAASKYAGNYGMQIVLGDANKYVYFGTLGDAKRIETEFYFDPNSVALNTWTGIARTYQTDANGLSLASVAVCKAPGATNYAITTRVRTYLQNNTTSAIEKNYWKSGLLCSTMTDAYHCLRLIQTLVPSSLDITKPAFKSSSKLYLDGSLVSTASGLVSYNYATIGQVQYGYLYNAVNAGQTGTIYFDNFGVAINDSGLASPMGLHGRHSPIKFHGKGNDMTDIRLRPYNQYIIAGTSAPLYITLDDVTVVSSPALKLYLNKEDKSTTIFTGSCVASGNIITTPTCAGWVQGSTYVGEVSYVLDGSTFIKRFQIKVSTPGEEL